MNTETSVRERPTPEQIHAMSDAELNAAIVNARGFYVAFVSDGFTGWVTDADNSFFLLQEMREAGSDVSIILTECRDAMQVWHSGLIDIAANSTTQLQRFIAEAYLIWKQENANGNG